MRREIRRVERERMNVEANGKVKERVIVTWNVQRLSMNENNRRRLRRVCERVEREGWEIVLLTEVKANEDGVIWMGEDDKRVAVVHSRMAGVLLRGDALRVWMREGQRMMYGKRVVTVELGGLRLVSVYQPIWGSDDREMEEYRMDV